MTKWQKIFAFIVVVAVGVFGYTVVDSYRLSRDMAEKNASPQGPLPDYVEPKSYDLTLRINPDKARFSGVVKIALEIKKPVKEIWLHGKGIEPNSVTLNTFEGPMALTYKEMGNSGVVRLTARETIAPQDAQLEIHYSAPFGTQLNGLYKVEEDGRSYAFTQFEAIDARRAFPGFDEPRFKVPFDLALEIKAEDKGFANTSEVKQEMLGDGYKRLTFATTKPLPSYLLAFAVGDFDVVEYQPIPANDIRHFDIPLRGIAVKGKGNKMTYALANTASILTLLERYFATPYPYEKLDLVAVPDLAPSAMENAGLVTYREPLLLLGDSPTYAQQRNYASVHAHELAHQWFGNLVTMPWWDDTWLNEAFATWMADRTANAWDDRFEFDRDLIRRGHQVMGEDALLSARQVREPVSNNDVITNAFDGITYQKGGAVLRMLERFIGPDTFREGVRLHMRRFAYDHADAYDFIESMSRVSHKKHLKEAFFSFLSQPGVPTVNLQWQCAGSKVEINVKQQRYLPLGSSGKLARTWHLPLCMTLVDRAGSDRPTTTICRMIDQAEQLVEADGCPLTIMPNNRGTGYYRFSYDKVQWQYLLKNLNRLTPAERFSVADNLAAAFRAGDIDASYYLQAIKPFTTDEDWDINTSPITELKFIADYIAEPEEKKRLAVYLDKLYQPLLDKLGLDADTPMDKDKPVATSLLRKRVVEFMALRIKEPHIRAELLKRAQAYMGELGKGDDKALNPDLLLAALSVGVEDAGKPFFDALKERIDDSTDAAFRRVAIRALGSTTDSVLAEEVRSMVLSLSIKNNERVYLIGAQMQQAENREDLYRWVKDYFGVLSKVLPEQLLSYTPLVAKGFCSKEKAKDLAQFFSDKIAHIQGAKRNLDMTLERINVCAALKHHQHGIFNGSEL